MTTSEFSSAATVDLSIDDDYDAPPTSEAIAAAAEATRWLAEVAPGATVEVSADVLGGMAVEAEIDGRSAWLSFLNSGAKTVVLTCAGVVFGHAMWNGASAARTERFLEGHETRSPAWQMRFRELGRRPPATDCYVHEMTAEGVSFLWQKEGDGWHGRIYGHDDWFGEMAELWAAPAGGFHGGWDWGSYNGAGGETGTEREAKALAEAHALAWYWVDRNVVEPDETED